MKERRKEERTSWRNAHAIRDSHDLEVTRIESEAFAAMRKRESSK